MNENWVQAEPGAASGQSPIPLRGPEARSSSVAASPRDDVQAVGFGTWGVRDAWGIPAGVAGLLSECRPELFRSSALPVVARPLPRRRCGSCRTRSRGGGKTSASVVLIFGGGGGGGAIEVWDLF